MLSVGVESQTDRVLKINMEKRYRVDKNIGEGSFGKVFKAKDRYRNEFVALKYVSKKEKQLKDVMNIRQECEIQKKLKHANIIQLLDFYETQEHIILVTEYAQGDLCALLRAKGPLKIQKVQLIASQLVSALHYLHSIPVLHRDLKPQNILVGVDGLVKVCDFGFARAMTIGQYLLTSYKGTPLYMAPEIMQHQPYDQNSDLWSLGCIVYELIVGRPPWIVEGHFIFELLSKILLEPIFIPNEVKSDKHCRSFLEGLLDKDPQKRLKWPELREHPFIEPFFLIEAADTGNFALTKALSPSQELAKEQQRQHLQKKMQGYTKMLKKTMKKLEDATKELKRCSTEGPIKSPAVSPEDRRNRRPQMNAHNPSDSDSASSYETMTSSSSMSDISEDGKTIVDLGSSPTPRLLFSPAPNHSGSHSRSHQSSSSLSKHKLISPINTIQSGMENLNITSSDRQKQKLPIAYTWKSDTFFTLHSLGADDKPIETEEWMYFLGQTMKEVQENPASLCEKHFLTVLVTPLRNHLAEAVVIGKIAILLAMPFTLATSKPDLQKNLEIIYMDAKVLPNLLYACKLVVRRRRIERNKMLNSAKKKGEELEEDLVAILEEEDFDALDKCMRLITYLVHIQKEFGLQLCDSVYILQGYPILNIFLQVHTTRPRLTIDTLSVLCQILRMLPNEASIVEDLLLHWEGVESDESPMVQLLDHQNPGIQSKALRLLGYLIGQSENVRKKFCRPKAEVLWSILTQAAENPNDSISAAADFTSSKLQRYVPIPQKPEETSDEIAVSQ